MIFRHKDHTSVTLGLHADDFAFFYEKDKKHITQDFINDIHAAGYTLKVNWEPTHYCGMHIQYVKDKYVHLDLPG